MNVRRYFLITDPCIENCNPGDPLIGNGIQYLLEEAEKRIGNHAVFNIVNIFSADEKIWERVYNEADYLIVCGTPQLGMHPEKAHHRHIWSYLEKASKQGVICANLWCGSGHPEASYNVDLAVDSIYKKTKPLLSNYFKYFNLITVRDSVTKRIINKAGYETYQFIDSVFFSANFHKVTKQIPQFNLLVPRDGGNIDLVAKVYKEIIPKLDEEYPTYILCHTVNDYLKYKEFFGKELICVNYPKELLKMYSQANQVISMRVHGSVPSVNFGAKIINISTDSRSNILEYIGHKSVDVHTLKSGKIKLSFFSKDVTSIKNRDKDNFIKLFYDKCQKYKEEK